MASIASKVTISSSSPRLLAGTGSDQTHLLVVCNSDRGLAGAFNANIVKAARLKAEELQAQGKTVLFFLVGSKGRAVISRVFRRQTIAQYDTTGIRDIGNDEATEFEAQVMELFEQGKFDVAHFFYSQFRTEEHKTEL